MRRILTTNEVAEKMRVSPKTVRDWLHAGHLRGFKAGGWKVYENDLEDFIEERMNRGEIV